MPKNRPFIKEVREACQLLRTTGEAWISKRRTAVQNGEDVPKDILTQIIKSAGQGCDTNTILQNCNTALVILQFLVSVTRGKRLLQVVTSTNSEIIPTKFTCRYRN